MRHTIPTGLVAVAAATLLAASVAVAVPEPAPVSSQPATSGMADGLLLGAGDGTSDLSAEPTDFPAEATFAGLAFPPTPTPTPSPTPSPAATPKPKAYSDTVANAKTYARNRLGATQYACIDDIFYYESKWNPLAENSRSGAYGIPQALPGSKMASMGSNWRTSPLTQVKWGIWYVNDRYGSACAAWDHIVAVGWY